ncbi:hypothetical protein [Terrisporobacter hibernicus]|uniref:DUF4190 domain-containing protein n=1 Tax=Terrisporobacter hibernicus TaxID=2813371 RepID=A0AAX2ZK41_9FIRM|nr:hypothetical protein [Terrisporobacter hibernicus]UEL49180.1 hypothetical protein JW646_06965 [Terrisporobacter hibernicus]
MKKLVKLIVTLIIYLLIYLFIIDDMTEGVLRNIIMVLGLIPFFIIIYQIGTAQFKEKRGLIYTEVIFAVIFILLFGISSLITRSDNIKSVKNATLYGLEGMTIGEAFSNGISNGEWSNGKKQEVIYIATSVDDQSNKCIIKFNVKDTGEIFISSVSLNDKNKNGYDLYSTIVGIYENAKYNSSGGFSKLYGNYLVSGRISTHKDDRYQENSEQESTDVSEEEQSQEVDKEQEGVNVHGDANIGEDYLKLVLSKVAYENGNEILSYENLILESGGYDDYNYELLNDYHNLNLTTECSDGSSVVYQFQINENGETFLIAITTYDQGQKRDYNSKHQIKTFMEELVDRYHNVNK